jgi:hypothetical protein
MASGHDDELAAAEEKAEARAQLDSELHELHGREEGLIRRE